MLSPESSESTFLNTGGIRESFEEEQSSIGERLPLDLAQLPEFEGKTQIFRELYGGGADILLDLEGHVSRGEYRVILGDDASGRIPTLFMANAIKEIYSKRDHKAPAVRFVTGGDRYGDNSLAGKFNSYQKGRKLAAYFKKLEPLIQQTTHERLLLVTEAISRGRGIAPLVEGLNEVGIPFDIACFSTPEDKKALEKKWGIHIAQGRGGAGVYSLTEWSGVTKNPNDLHTRPASLHEKTPSQRHASMKYARVEAKLTAHQLASWFLGSKDGRQDDNQSNTIEERLAA